MQYRYEFEIASSILLVIILVHYIFVRQYPTKKAHVFLTVLCASILECAFNIASSIGLANPTIVPQGVNDLLAFAFFVLEGFVSYLLFHYILLICSFEPKQEKITLWVATIPFLFFELMVVLNPFTGFFYTFIENQYYQGFGANFGYYYIGFYFLMNVLIVMIQSKKVSTRLKTIVLFYSIVAVLAVVIQFFYRQLILTSAGNAIIVFLLYLSMQNPSEHFDSLTGTGNVGALKLQLQQWMNRKKNFSVYSIEIKNIRRLQSLFGEENVEIMIGQIGEYLSHTFGRLCVFHAREESFEILVPDNREAQEVQTILQNRFAQSWKVQKNMMYAETIICSSQYPKHFHEVAEFFDIQGYLLEIARGSKANIIKMDEELLTKYNHRKQVETALKRAVENRKLEVYFQPIYSLEERRVVSLEALTRMNDEVLGFISPDEFIPLAEKDGSIVEIGEIVLEECCRFLSKHILANDSLGIRTIQVNVSAVQCMQQSLEKKIQPILEKYHIPPSMITLELTESTEIQATDLMLRQMKALNHIGIDFAADDYGTGNSNFSYLVKFPFKEVKIDRTMTWAYFENETARIILENEIFTMRKLGIDVVVEGIETKEQSDAMEKIGVKYIQGYYYGKPMSQKECLLFLRRGRGNADFLLSQTV